MECSLWPDCSCIVPPLVSSAYFRCWTRGIASQYAFRTTGFQTFLPGRQFRAGVYNGAVALSHLGTGTRFIVADSIRNLGQEDQAAVMPHRMLEQTTSRNGCWANHKEHQ